MRANLRLAVPAAQGAAEPGLTPTDLIRDRIASRCPRLDAIAPDALDLSAELTAELHRAFCGDASQISPHRAHRYVGMQIRGEEHPVTVEDLALWTRRYPVRMRPFAARLAAECGLETTVAAACPTELDEAVARVAESQGALVAEATRSSRDGVIDDGEDVRIDSRIREAERQLAALKGAKRALRAKKGRTRR